MIAIPGLRGRYYIDIYGVYSAPQMKKLKEYTDYSGRKIVYLDNRQYFVDSLLDKIANKFYGELK